jgi:hypothetical protein
MGVMHRLADPRHQLQPLPCVEALRFRVTVERLATNELHGEEGLRAELGVHRAGLIDLSDTGGAASGPAPAFPGKNGVPVPRLPGPV